LQRDRSMTIWEHISELVKRMKIVVLTLVVSTAVFAMLPGDLSVFTDPAQFLTFYKPLSLVVLEAIRNYVKPAQLELIAGQLTSGIELYFLVSVAFGAVVTAPVFAYQLYKFIDPALYPDERRSVYPFVLSFTILFITGGLFGFFVILPFMFWSMVPFLLWVGAQPVIFINDFYTLVFLSIVLSGISFTFPVFFVLLVKFHVVGTSIIRNNRKYFYAGLYVVTAVLTPDGGPIADLALFFPMAALVEVAIAVAKRYEKGEKPKEPPTRRCRYCGEPIGEKDVFCPHCKRSQV